MQLVDLSRRHIALYRAALAQAARESEALLSRVLVATQRSLHEDLEHARTLPERDQLQVSIKLLDENSSLMCQSYPQILKDLFEKKRRVDSQFGVLGVGELNLDDLEHMDAAEVHERVEMARTLQFVLLTTEASLSEVNACICALLELDKVRPERSPLRPQTYVNGLRDLFIQMSVPVYVRVVWMSHLSSALGDALNAFYRALTRKLRSHGVEPMGFTATGSARAFDVRLGTKDKDRSVPTSKIKPSVLTLDRLRGLLAGELDAAVAAVDLSFDTQFSREFESDQLPAVRPSGISGEARDTDFASTVPAAFEALQEMEQVDQMVTRIEQRPVHASSTLETVPQSVRQQLMGRCRDLSQAMSLEVVALMVENLVRDERLLEPIRRVIEDFEPALLRLVLVDARFFSDKQHPGRKLLQEITQRGLAYSSTNEPEFGVFLMSLHRFVTPLARLKIEGAQPFEVALTSLKTMWQEALVQSVKPRQLNDAVKALEQAEERNLLAEEMVAAMECLPEMQRVPSSVAEFLCGPWAQVMACADLKHAGSSDDPGQYKDLVNALLWSAQPELTQKNIPKLTKLVPRLLSKLREGLSLIDYPSLKTSAFFDLLMKLHQQAFRSPEQASETVLPLGLTSSLMGNQDHWVAPAEAKASGFMDLPDDLPMSMRPQSKGGARVTPPVPFEKSSLNSQADKLRANASDGSALAVGAWIELLHKGQWQRTQLTWISPQSTMYLFTSVHGQTQSMTRRSLDKLLAIDTLRVVSEQTMLDGALDAVVQKAMLNSLDIRLF